MDSRKLFNKHYSRLAAEGIIKSIICGLIVGFSASFITAFIAFLLVRSGLVASIVVALVFTAAATIVFYYKVFRPTTEAVARRVDRLGLEERMITMLDLKDDDSYIASRQRQDAQDILSSSNSSRMKFAFPKLMIIAAAAVFVLATTMTAVSADPMQVGTGEGTIYNAIYRSSENGTVLGRLEQEILFGESSTPVVAVADDGYVFAGWSDGFSMAERVDYPVRRNIDVSALFIEITIGEPSEGKGQEIDFDIPVDLEKGGSAPAPSDPEQGGGEGAGGKDEPRNQIIDGETYYREHYQMYLQMVIEALENNEDIPPEIREIIEIYFGIIV